jgi:hypothetical protein
MTAFAACLSATAAAASAQEMSVETRFDRDVVRPVIDFSGVQEGLAEGPTQVLILGMRHLAQVPEEDFDLADLSLLLDRLEAWEPAIIATEDTAGRHCDVLELYADQYEGVAGRYCADITPAAEALGMTRAEADSAAYAAWRALDEDPAPAERRRLAALFLAAGDDSSAVVQWLQLPEGERGPGDGLSEAAAEAIAVRASSRNESVSVGAALAARLGLERVHPMDDRSADVLFGRARDGAGPAIQRVWSANINGQDERNAAAEALWGTPEGFIDYVLTTNSAEFQQGVIDSDFATVAKQPDAEGAARAYLAWYQARGLRMAANVVEAAANHPGEKVLVVVGSSHTAYFEAYLDALHDFELVRLGTVIAQ